MKTVALGMSGGVDSSAAAYLLCEQGVSVIGITLLLCPGAGAEQAVCDAKRVAKTLGIPHYVADFRDVFQTQVIDYFCAAYKNGQTPNPCVACNKHIKFGAMLDFARELGADGIATGHYARVEFDKRGGRYLLKRCAAGLKDQSYALYRLSQEQLSCALFPLGAYPKDQIRGIAQKIGLEVANKPDSQEICFVPDDDYAGYIEKTTGVHPLEGDFLDTSGNVIGRHRGIIHYTVGQRKGLGMTFGRPMYVVGIDAAKNAVVLGEAGEQLCRTIYAQDVNYIAVDRLNGPASLYCKTRYTANLEPCVVTPMENGCVKVERECPKTAAAPGQAVVFYDGDTVVGGATIVQTKP